MNAVKAFRRARAAGVRAREGGRSVPGAGQAERGGLGLPGDGGGQAENGRLGNGGHFDRAGREAAIALAAVIPAGMRRPGRAAPLWGPSERARSAR